MNAGGSAKERLVFGVMAAGAAIAGEAKPRLDDPWDFHMRGGFPPDLQRGLSFTAGASFLCGAAASMQQAPRWQQFAGSS